MQDTREPLRNYPVPDPANKVNDEFPRLTLAITMIASDVSGAYASIATKAPVVHTHTIDQISGLQGILDSKLNVGSTFALGTLSDVNATGAANFMALAYINGTWQPWVVNAININGLAAVIAGTAIDAGKITSGTLDPARIPALQAFTTIISSGDLTALTSLQQAQIVQGEHVTTTDGRRWIYTGTGSKTLAASYIELSDVTPDWSVIANKPAAYADWVTAISGPTWFTNWNGKQSGLVKVTRYLTPGTFTHTRSPGVTRADIRTLGATGGRPAAGWASGLITGAGGPGTGGLTIKYNYALPATATVVVGAGSVGNGGTSSFNSVIFAGGGGASVGANGAANSTFYAFAGVGAAAAVGSVYDEIYGGVAGGALIVTGGIAIAAPSVFSWMRDVLRVAPAGTASGNGNSPSQNGDNGAVEVIEYFDN